jgi:hypothetical protein
MSVDTRVKLSLDDFIAKLESIRAEHGGDMLVMMVDEMVAVPVYAPSHSHSYVGPKGDTCGYTTDPCVYITDLP